MHVQRFRVDARKKIEMFSFLNTKLNKKKILAVIQTTAVAAPKIFVFDEAMLKWTKKSLLSALKK